jgi:hypothetical protein
MFATASLNVTGNVTVEPSPDSRFVLYIAQDGLTSRRACRSFPYPGHPFAEQKRERARHVVRGAAALERAAQQHQVQLAHLLHAELRQLVPTERLCQSDIGQLELRARTVENLRAIGLVLGAK